MTIQEVIKSGKPFKRKPFKYWIIVKSPFPGDELEFSLLDKDMHVELLPDAILADDWEVLEES